MFDENYLGIMFSSLNMELAPTVLSVCTPLPMKKKNIFHPTLIVQAKRNGAVRWRQGKNGVQVQNT